jgi:nucleotide-binding universal stress UspA family protein
VYGQASIERILCATDSFAGISDAMALALGVARAQHARILLLQVQAKPGAAPARAEGVSTERVVLPGWNGGGAIVDQAKSWPADLVVMGTLGGRGPGEWGPGSATEHVLRKAPCPVLLAPSPGLGPDATGRAPLRRILCPTDFSDASLEAFEYGALMARALAVRITPLHVFESSLESGELSELRVPEYQMDASQEARERLTRSIPAHVRPFCSDVPAVALGRPHREILRLAREQDVCLIVLGVHDRRALDKVLWGSTVRHVVREARCPVLVVRAGQAAAAGPAAPQDQVRRAS